MPPCQDRSLSVAPEMVRDGQTICLNPWRLFPDLQQRLEFTTYYYFDDNLKSQCTSPPFRASAHGKENRRISNVEGNSLPAKDRRPVPRIFSFCGFAVHFCGWTLDIGYSAFVLLLISQQDRQIPSLRACVLQGTTYIRTTGECRSQLQEFILPSIGKIVYICHPPQAGGRGPAPYPQGLSRPESHSPVFTITKPSFTIRRNT